MPPICWLRTDFLVVNSMEEQGVISVGAWWLGRKHITVAEFRNHYGVYPRTVCHIPNHVVPEMELAWLLKSLWWMKQYPTEEVIKNHGSSPAHFRNRLWPCLDLLLSKLPEVLFSSLSRCGAVAVSPALVLERCASIVCASVLVYPGHDDREDVEAAHAARRLRPIRVPLLEPAHEDLWGEARSRRGNAARASPDWDFCCSGGLARLGNWPVAKRGVLSNA